MTTYTLMVTHLPTGHCKDCDTIDPDIRADFDVEDFFSSFEHVYSSSVLLVIKMFPELFMDFDRKISFGLHFERPKTAGMEKIRIIVVMWMRPDRDVEYYIDKITKNTILTYDQRVALLKEHGVPDDMRERVDLMKRSTRSIIYPTEQQPDGLQSGIPNLPIE